MPVAPSTVRPTGSRHNAPRGPARGRWLRGTAVASAVLTAWTAAPSAAAPLPPRCRRKPYGPVTAQASS